MKKTNQILIPINEESFSINEKDIAKTLKKVKVGDPNIVFMGNTKYSLIGGDIINQSFDISLVVTKPNSPTKDWADKKHLLTLEIEKLDEQIVKEIAQYEPDYIIVEDYSLLLPDSLLNLPKVASLNIHHSLLPKFRGPAPVPFAILSGDKITGVTVIKMNNKIDSGDILAQKKVPILNEDTADSLLIKLNQLGGELMVEILKDYSKITPKKQNESKASYSKMMKKEDGYVEIDNIPEAEKLNRMVRAYHPWPGVWTRWNNRIVKFLPGGLIQMEGKKAVPLRDFLNGYPDFPLKQL